METPTTFGDGSHTDSGFDSRRGPSPTEQGHPSLSDKPHRHGGRGTRSLVGRHCLKDRSGLGSPVPYGVGSLRGPSEGSGLGAGGRESHAPVDPSWSFGTRGWPWTTGGSPKGSRESFSKGKTPRPPARQDHEVPGGRGGAQPGRPRGSPSWGSGGTDLVTRTYELGSDPRTTVRQTTVPLAVHEVRPTGRCDYDHHTRPCPDAHTSTPSPPRSGTT